MAQNLDANKIHQFITSDFRSALNALASSKGKRHGRGNFMFAMQTMVLLEFAARLCRNNMKALGDLTNELDKIEPKYFASFPSPCVKIEDFKLPSKSRKGDELLGVLFDLARNGLAHQYQQIMVELKDGKHFGLTLTEASHGRTLRKVARRKTRKGHLEYHKDKHGDLWLKVCPDLLFVDFERAIKKSRLLERGLELEHFKRSMPKDATKIGYGFDSNALEKSFKTSGLRTI